MPNLTDKSERLLGLDLVRFVSFYAILVFHLSYAFWARDGHMSVAVDSRWLDPFEVYARALVFSGFTVIFLSFFLYGLKPSVSGKWKYLWLLLMGFLVVWTYATEEVTDAWDIYQFLLVTVGVVALLRRLKVPPAWSAFVSFVLVSTPLGELERLRVIPEIFKPALFGNCTNLATHADWPLLPWIFYPLLAFSVGALVRAQREDFGHIKTMEMVAWATGLVVALPFMGAYYVTPLGTNFGCYVFRRPPGEFWAHQIWIWFLIRISLIYAVQNYLGEVRLVKWISARQVNRRFFAVYFLHFPLVFAAANMAHDFHLAYSASAYIAAFFSIVLTLEALPIVIVKIWAKIKR